MSSQLRRLDVIIPFYRNAHAADCLCRSLVDVRQELAEHGCGVVAINDSPGDAELSALLTGMPARLGPIGFDLIENTSNIGFVRAANAGLAYAMERGHDALLLNSDTIVFPGAVAAMRRVAALDCMTGFVNPRSNNATLCSFPRQDEFRTLPPEQAHALFLRLSRYLPEFQYAPTGVGFCLLIKFSILEEFGLFDEDYGAGYNEENDLIMRANRCGYRVALANRAYVYHLGGASFALTGGGDVLEAKNAAFLARRYPEFPSAVARYCSGSRYAAEWLLPALIPDETGRRDLVFDFSSFGPYHTGTFLAGVQVATHAAKQWSSRFRLHAMVSREAMSFHGLDRVEGLECIPPGDDRIFAVGLRFAQPFHYEHMARLSSAAVVNVYAMLDPIALDCLYLDTQDLETLWSDVFAYADGVVYISDFVRDQFHLRFPRRPGLKELVAYLSLDLRDYAPAGAGAREGEFILVIGNDFSHKRLEPTVDALYAAFPAESIVVLGLERATIPGVTTYASGKLSGKEVERLFDRAKFVVYPSVYEGFGIPILEVLARSKPVLARDLPVTRAVRDRIAAHENLLLYGSTRDLIRILRAGFPSWRAEGSPRRDCSEHSWESMVCRLGDFVDELASNVSPEEVLLPRLEHLRRAGAGCELWRALQDRDARIGELLNSLSWRITAPLRAVYDFARRWKR